MALHRDVRPASPLSPPQPLSRSRGLGFLDLDDLDDLDERRLAGFGAGTSLPRTAGSSPASEGAEPEPAEQPSPWFAGYRLCFTCDLELLDEAH